MAELTYRAAIAGAIAQEMDRDTTVVMIGEDIGAAGGVFKLTEGLFDRFGPERIRDTPISEQAIIGAAMGAAMTGLRPIAELMFSDFFAVTWDMVVNQIAKTRYMTNGQVALPLVIRTANGAGLRFGAQHSQSIENWAMAIPGLKVVAPSNPADMFGLLAAAIRDPDPVIVCEHKALFAAKGEVPDGEHVTPLGEAAIARRSRRITPATNTYAARP
jgi:pyruvate dehydrogenase E1 component beta subunit